MTDISLSIRAAHPKKINKLILFRKKLLFVLYKKSL